MSILHAAHIGDPRMTAEMSLSLQLELVNIQSYEDAGSCWPACRATKLRMSGFTSSGPSSCGQWPRPAPLPLSLRTPGMCHIMLLGSFFDVATIVHTDFGGTMSQATSKRLIIEPGMLTVMAW